MLYFGVYHFTWIGYITMQPHTMVYALRHMHYTCDTSHDWYCQLSRDPNL